MKTDDIDIILDKIAKYCIKNKLYRNGNIFHYFCDHPEIKKILPKDHHGYMFLDKEIEYEDLYSGMIRIYWKECNPKWYFLVTKDDPNEIEIGFC